MTTQVEQLNLSEIIKAAMRHELSTVHTALPGRIESYNATLQQATIAPLINKKYRDGVEENMPVLINVPVIFPRTANSIISLPITNGDLVLVVFSERSMDTWLSSTGGEAAPLDNRFFDLSDGIAIPGLYPFGVESLADPTNILIKNTDATITLAPTGETKITSKDGTIKLSADNKLAMGNSSAELLDLFDQALAGIEAITVTTPDGTFPINNIATFTSIRTLLNGIKSTLP